MNEYSLAKVQLNILILKFMFVIVALTARAGQYIFCEKVVRVNQDILSESVVTSNVTGDSL